jgi:hypothetical protein
MANDNGEEVLFPLIGYATAIVDGAVALRLDFVTTREEYASTSGEMQQYVMTPEAAIEIGRSLQQRGASALGTAN